MSISGEVQMMQPLSPPLMLEAEYARQEQLARHLCLHWSRLTLASAVAFVVSGSLTPRSGRKPSPVQLRRVMRAQPAEPSLSAHSCGEAGVNPVAQPHIGEALASQTP
jgi:hypothetical protein